MPSISVEAEQHPIAGGFRIARGSRTHAETIVCKAEAGGTVGWGEAVPYPRYGETIEEASETIRAHATIEDREELRERMPPGAARNALDCALWDWEAKRDGRAAHLSVCSAPPRPLTTALTISLGDTETMAAAARAARGRRLLKIKLGAGDGHDAARIRAVATAAPDTRLILDANEGWHADEMRELMIEAARASVVLVEQPLPAGEDDVIGDMPHPVPICADESAHVSADLDELARRYDFVNIKLDKTGGLTEALRMRQAARRLGLGVMVGCMVSTSLAMAPAVLLAQEADYADLDGPLLLERDRSPGLTYSGSLVSPPPRSVWG